MRGIPGRALPTLKECLEENLRVARLTSPQVRAVGICFNTSAMHPSAAQRLCRETEGLLGLPCTDPIAFGVETLVDELLCPVSSERSISASR